MITLYKIFSLKNTAEEYISAAFYDVQKNMDIRPYEGYYVQVPVKRQYSSHRIMVLQSWGLR